MSVFSKPIVKIAAAGAVSGALGGAVSGALSPYSTGKSALYGAGTGALIGASMALGGRPGSISSSLGSVIGLGMSIKGGMDSKKGFWNTTAGVVGGYGLGSAGGTALGYGISALAARGRR